MNKLLVRIPNGKNNKFAIWSDPSYNFIVQSVGEVFGSNLVGGASIYIS